MRIRKSTNGQAAGSPVGPRRGRGLLKGSSTFFDRAIAEHSVGQVLAKNQLAIDAWVSSGKKKLTLYGRAEEVAGQYLRAGRKTTAQEVCGVRVLLRPDASMPGGYRVHTAFVMP